MNCTITLKVGKEDSIEISVESSKLPDNYSSLKELLIEENKWDEFLEKLQNTLRSENKNIPLKVSEIVDSSSHIITNTTVEILKKRFPSINFPEDTDDLKFSDKKVRYMQYYKTVDGRLKYGRLISEKTGEELFIVDAKNISQLANYFLFYKSIMSDNILNQSTDEVLDELYSIYLEAHKNEKLRNELDTFYNNNNTLTAELEKISKLKPEELNDEQKEILKQDKILKLKSLLITFVQNKNGFKNITYSKNGESYGIYGFLDKMSSQILGVSQKRKHFSDPQIESLSNSGIWSKNFEEKTYQKSFILDISSSEFKQKLNQLLKELNEETVSKNKEIKERNKGKDKDQKEKTEKLVTETSLLNKKLSEMENEFRQLFGEEVINKYENKSITGWNILISEILNKDKGLNLQYNSESDRTITLEKYFTTLESAFGIGFDELQTLQEPEYYNQYYIQTRQLKDGTSEYYVTKYYTTEKQFASKFDSLEEAKNYIDSLNLEIVNNSYKQLHLDTTDDYDNMWIKLEHGIKPANIITILDYKVPDFRLSEIPEEMIPFLSNNKQTYTVSNFVKFVKNNLSSYLSSSFYTTEEENSIIKNINTPEKIFLFIRQLNTPEYDKSNKEKVLELSETIGQLSTYKYYFVKKNNNGLVQLIPIKEKILPEFRKDKTYPIRSIIDAANQVLSPRLGNVKMNIITNEEAENLTGAKEREITAKAFIMNGEIYINKDLADAEDLFHEYSHILLGYLKNNEDENIRNIYFKLLEEVWNLGENDIDRENIQNTYWDYARIDQMEEYFALKFAKWINDNSKTDYDKIFYNEVLTKESTKLFDPNNYTKSIKELFGTNLQTVLLSFNSEIGFFLKENPTLADDYKDLFTLSRKKSEWIRQQINQGNLEERNC